jgi:hypothetical protein
LERVNRSRCWKGIEHGNKDESARVQIEGGLTSEGEVDNSSKKTNLEGGRTTYGRRMQENEEDTFRRLRHRRRVSLHESLLLCGTSFFESQARRGTRGRGLGREAERFRVNTKWESLELWTGYFLCAGKLLDIGRQFLPPIPGRSK